MPTAEAPRRPGRPRTGCAYRDRLPNGELRWFYKRAMQDFLPDEIITKNKHGFGLPFGV